MSRPIKHGHSVGKTTRIYNIWRGIRQRCNNPLATGYSDYGGRGITISPLWDTFLDFEFWAINNNYNSKLSIERRNVNGNYEPNNCYWATNTIQAANKRKRLGTKSKYIGVRLARCGKYEVYINIHNKRTQLGFFEDEVIAAQARDDYIKQNKFPHKLNF